MFILYAHLPTGALRQITTAKTYEEMLKKYAVLIQTRAMVDIFITNEVEHQVDYTPKTDTYLADYPVDPDC